VTGYPLGSHGASEPQYGRPEQRTGSALAAGLFWLVAGALAIGATFAPLYRYTITYQGQPAYGYAPSGWAWNIFGPTDSLDPGRLGTATPYGIPIVIAGIILLVAGALAFRGASNLTGFLGTGLLVGAAGILAVENFSRAAVPRPESANWEVGLGTWLIVVAAIIAIVGAVFAASRIAQPRGWIAAPLPEPTQPKAEPPEPPPGHDEGEQRPRLSPPPLSAQRRDFVAWSPARNGQAIVRGKAGHMAEADRDLHTSPAAPRTWRLRIELDDNPGVLARITTRLAAKDCNVLGLSILPVPGAVVDEIVVRMPPGLPPAELVYEIRAEGGRCLGITQADVHDLVDQPTATLRATAQALDQPQTAPESMRTLLAADSVTVQQGEHQSGDDGGHRVVLPLGPDTTVVARRGWAPFTDVELARAAAFSDLLSAGSVRVNAPTALITPDGAGVVLRRGDDGDIGALAELHARCSAQTLYARYHSGVRSLPRRMLQRLLGPPRGGTLVAMVGSQVVAIGQLIRTAQPQEAEVSLLVEDRWQHKGIGTAMLSRLAGIARAEGHTEMVAWCLPGEQGFQHAAERTGLDVSVRHENGMHRVGMLVHPAPTSSRVSG
jgi:GNAT superfamily N-acetyltransferase